MNREMAFISFKGTCVNIGFERTSTTRHKDLRTRSAATTVVQWRLNTRGYADPIERQRFAKQQQESDEVSKSIQSAMLGTITRYTPYRSFYTDAQLAMRCSNFTTEKESEESQIETLCPYTRQTPSLCITNCPPNHEDHRSIFGLSPSHLLHEPYQCRSRHFFRLVVGRCVELGEDTGPVGVGVVCADVDEGAADVLVSS